MAEILAFAVILANGTGQFALIAVLLGSLKRSRPGLARAVALKSILFAACGLLAMYAPAEVGAGVFVDLRGVIVGLAGAFAGWPAAFAAALATALYRITLGGIYVQGCFSILIAAAMGVLWRRLVRGRQGTGTGTGHLLGLGLMIALHPLPLATVPEAWQASILVPTVSTLFLASILGALVLGKLVQREERMIAQERRLTDDAIRDPLTALLNRRGFEAAYFRARAERPDATVAVLLVDVDFFKSVNDVHGHDVGDLVLRSIAGTIREELPAGADASRHGGEEFAALLVGTDPDAALRAAERVRCRIAETPVQIRPGHSIAVTASIGVTHCGDGRTALQDLLQGADQALYRAKRAGRNRVERQAPGAASEDAAGSARLRLASSR